MDDYGNAYGEALHPGDGGGGGNSANSSSGKAQEFHWDPSNKDSDYREEAISEAMKRFNVNVPARDISYNPGLVGGFGHLIRKTGKIEIGPDAFDKSFDFLGAIIGHERVHYYQYGNTIPPWNAQIEYGNEAAAYQWNVDNFDRFNLSVDEQNLFRGQRDIYLESLDAKHRVLYDEGYFNAELP